MAAAPGRGGAPIVGVDRVNPEALKEVARSAIGHRRALIELMVNACEDAMLYTATGQRSHREAAERHDKAVGLVLHRRSRRRIVFGLHRCPCCKSDPRVVGGMDCGIDGGPGPVSIKGVQIRCSRNCGMKTDVHESYPSREEQLKALRRAAAEWNGFGSAKEASMAKATLEFSLPEERTEHLLAINGGKWFSVVWGLDQYLRNIIKHDLPQPSAEQVRSHLRSVMDDYNLSMDEVD